MTLPRMARKMRDMMLCSSYKCQSRYGRCAWNGRRSLMIASSEVEGLREGTSRAQCS